MSLNKKFQIYCENNKFEINKEQIKVIDNIENFYKKNFNNSLINKIFKKNSCNIGFYFIKHIFVT